jgi:hypothetical protein
MQLKKIALLLLVAMAGLAGAAVAQTAPAPPGSFSATPDVGLAWCPNTESDLAGYKVYFKVAGGAYGTPVDVGKVIQWTVNGLTPGQNYTFAATAYSTSRLESGKSNEITVMIPLATGPPVPPPLLAYAIVNGLTTTSATVAWVTTADCSGTVTYGLAADQLNKYVVANNLGTTDHLAIISGLLTRTHYFYQVSGACGTNTFTGPVRSFNTK